MEIAKLQTAVFDKTGIRLDRTDPIFALVALNNVVIEDLLATAQEQWTQSNSELDAKIVALAKLNEQILAASKDLAARVNQAHMAAGVKAAAEAKVEIFNAARDAVTSEMSKAASIIMEGTEQLDKARKRARAGNWKIAIVSALLGGMVAASMVLAVMHVS